MQQSRWLMFLFGWCAISSVALAKQTDVVDLGRSIYEYGIGRDGREISATLHGSVNLTGAAIACAGCHGKHGQGGGEAFIRAPDIRWLNLSQTYPARRAGMAEASYDLRSFRETLHSGVSPLGRRLDPAMPRFDLADDEVQGLIAFLSEIDQAQTMTQPRLSILGLLPKSGRNAQADELDYRLKNCPAGESGAPIAAIHTLYFDSPDDAITQLNDQLTSEPNRFILLPFLLGWEEQYARAMQKWNVPTLLPFSFLDRIAESQWHYPFPGLEAQILALLKSVKADGYKAIRIQYAPNDALSAKLNLFARKTALSQGISVVPDDGTENQAKPSSPWLWLKTIDEGQINSERLVQTLHLVPVLFFAANRMKMVTDESPFSGWRIAYPYKPRSKESGSWLTPVSAWAGAACEFLLRVGERTINPPLWPDQLEWGEDLYLYRQPDLDVLSDQVFIDNNPAH